MLKNVFFLPRMLKEKLICLKNTISVIVVELYLKIKSIESLVAKRGLVKQVGLF